MSIRAAIAYEDWLISGATLAVSLPEDWTPINDESNLFTPQLSDCVGFLRPEFTGTGTWSVDRAIDGVRDIALVSLLDFRHDGGSYLIQVYVLPSSGEPGLIYEGVDYGGYPSSDFVRHLHIPLESPVSGVGVRVSVTVLSSSAETQISIGRVWAGPLYLVPEGIKRGWRSGLIDPGESQRSPGGQNYPDPEQRRRWVKMSFSHVDYEQAYGNELNTVMDFQQLQYRIGRTTPCIVFPRMQSHAMHRVGIYGAVTEWDPIENVGGDYFATGLRIEEDL
ncbi:cell spreading mediator [Microcystis phage vB_MaeS-yong1]|nr:cell spreading mediator [Microcystis phage vB_MaeS-yong1]